MASSLLSFRPAGPVATVPAGLPRQRGHQMRRHVETPAMHPHGVVRLGGPRWGRYALVETGP